MHLCRQGSQLSGEPRDGRRPPIRSLAACCHPGDQPTQKRHRSPLFSGSRRLLPSVCQEFCSHCRSTACPDPERHGLPLELRVPGRLRPLQKRSSPPAPSLPSPTSAYLSVSIWTHQLQASAQSSLKSGKERSASSAVRLAPSTKQKKPTPPLSWNVSPLFGPLRSSDHTSCPCHSRFTRTTALCNGSKQ